MSIIITFDERADEALLKQIAEYQNVEHITFEEAVKQLCHEALTDDRKLKWEAF